MFYNGVYDVYKPGYVYASDHFDNQYRTNQVSNNLPLVKVQLYGGIMRNKHGHLGLAMQQSDKHTITKLIKSLKIGFIAYQALCVTIAILNNIEANPGPNCQNSNAKKKLQL